MEFTMDEIRMIIGQQELEKYDLVRQLNKLKEENKFLSQEKTNGKLEQSNNNQKL